MERKKISELAKQVRGVSYKPEDLHNNLDDNSVILLRANNISNGKINFDDVVYVDKSKVSAEQYLCKGDILICASSGSKQLVGKAASVDFDIECTFGAFCKVVRPNPNILDYLGVFFQSNNYRQKISELAIGANINNIRNEHIDNLEITIGNNTDNIGVVRKITAIQSIISARQQELQKLDDLVKARFVELFGDPIRNEKSWKTLALDDACNSIVDCPHSTPNYTAENTGYMCVRTSIVKKNKILWDEIEYISEEEFQQRIQRKRPEKGDVIYTREGAILGIAAVIDRDCNVALGQRSMLLSPNLSKCTSEFISVAMNCDSFLDNALKGMSGSASPHINVGDIKAFNMIMPPIEMQMQFSAFVNQLDKSKFVVQQALDKAQLLFDSLMQKYFG